MNGKYTLSTFYKSNAWWKLLQNIKNDRANEEGLLICEHCGKPMVRAYDIIGHHVEELTEDNVNDYNVSLNPSNIKLVHHRCHNRIHNKLGSMSYGCRHVYIVYGSPLSGKSTWVRESMNEGDLVIDMDSIWQCVSGCDRYTKPNRLKSIVFSTRDYLLECVKYRRGKWQNAYIIGGYPLISERERLCRELDAELIFIDTSKEECMSRLLMIEDNRDKDEWEKYISNWWITFGKGSPQVI